MNETTRTPSCSDDFEPGTLSVAQARTSILETITPVTDEETVSTRQALLRVLSRPVHSPHNVPGHRNTAVDGFALNGQDLPSHGHRDFVVSHTLYAGSDAPGLCLPGQCVRIMTGAAMPEDSDTVVMIEHSQEQADGRIRIDASHKLGQNVRQAGEDIAEGSQVFTAGQRLKPAELGILSSLGFASVPCLRRPKVAIFSTGNELCELEDGAALKSGELFDSNRYNLIGMLQRLGLEVMDLGILKDEPDELRHALQTASEQADAIITSGGVSMGDADFVKPVLKELGDLDFWKIAMKPGRPLSFGRIGKAAFFGLPGNPVAVAVTFYQFVQAALEKLAGTEPMPPMLIPAISTAAIRKRPGRTEFIRAVYKTTHEGLVVESLGTQGSGILTSMSRANCFIVLNEDCDGIQSNDWVKIQPFQGLV